jgi:hypothetical protein
MCDSGRAGQRVEDLRTYHPASAYTDARLPALYTMDRSVAAKAADHPIACAGGRKTI